MEKLRMIVKQVGQQLYGGGENCGNGSCPSVIEREDGKLIIVGKQLGESQKVTLDQSQLVKVYGDEEAIVVDRELLLAAAKAIS